MNEMNNCIKENTELFGMSVELARIIIPLLVTLFVFFSGYVAQWINRQKTARKEIIVFKDFIINWIKVIENGIQNQCLALRDFSENVKLSDDLRTEPLNFYMFNLEQFDKIPHEKMVRIFVQNTVGKREELYQHVNNIIQQFHFLNQIESDVRESYALYQKQVFEYMDKWNNSYSKLDHVVFEWPKRYRATANQTSKNFHDSVVELFQKYRNSSPSEIATLSHSMNTLVTPLSEMTNVVLEHEVLDYAYELATVLQELRIVNRNFLLLNSGFGQRFRTVNENITASYKILMEEGAFFNNARIKSFWFIR